MQVVYSNTDGTSREHNIVAAVFLGTSGSGFTDQTVTMRTNLGNTYASGLVTPAYQVDVQGKQNDVLIAHSYLGFGAPYIPGLELHISDVHSLTSRMTVKDSQCAAVGFTVEQSVAEFVRAGLTNPSTTTSVERIFSARRQRPSSQVAS